jgi:hypothetical protein
MLIVLLTAILTSCGGDDEEASPQNTPALLTAHPWKLSRVTVSGVDKTTVYSGLQLTFSGNSYTAQPSNPIWLTGGSWSLESETTIRVIPQGQDPLTVTLISISDNALKVSLDWDDTTLDAGRAGSVEGSHVFEFIR